MSDSIKTIVADAYPAIAADLLRPLLRLMNICLQQFGGDLTKFLVILVVVLWIMMYKDFANRSQKELLSGEIGRAHV